MKKSLDIPVPHSSCMFTLVWWSFCSIEFLVWVWSSCFISQNIFCKLFPSCFLFVKICEPVEAGCYFKPSVHCKDNINLVFGADVLVDIKMQKCFQVWILICNFLFEYYAFWFFFFRIITEFFSRSHYHFFAVWPLCCTLYIETYLLYSLV